uniref:RHS repeat-associated core domain-containing protein n=1 Tax=Paenirhodobacter enshiensis TaxID=1105367 RepID=UPI0035AF5D5B
MDQVGTIRRVFESAASAPAFDYTPYGTPVQAAVPSTDMVYAGLFRDADSGLYLSATRAYDPVPGRWPSRDPIGGGVAPIANLYTYASGNPVSYSDPNGENPVAVAMVVGAVAGIVAGDGTDLAMQLYNNGGRWSCVDLGHVISSAAFW